MFKTGGSVAGPLFVVRFVRRDTESSRWGFAVGKKLDKRATIRNRMRRRLRAAAATTSIAGGDVVVVARSRSLDAPFDDLVREFDRLMKRTGLPAAAKA